MRELQEALLQQVYHPLEKELSLLMPRDPSGSIELSRSKEVPRDHKSELPLL